MNNTLINEAPITARSAAALGGHLFVKYTAVTDGIKYVNLCGAGDEPQGVTTRPCSSGEDVSFNPLTSPGTMYITMTGSITALQKVYSGASGKGSATAIGRARGIALQDGVDGQIIEMLPIVTNEVTMEFAGDDLTARCFILEQFDHKPLITAEVSALASSMSETPSDSTLEDVTTGGTAADTGPVENNLGSLMKKVNNLHVANRNFEIAGTNATSALVTFAATKSGIILTTAGAAADQMIMQPRAGTVHSRFGTGVSTTISPRAHWNASLSSITGIKAKWSMALTNAVDLGTDADQFGFYFLDTDHANFQAIYSIGGVDTTVDTGIPVVADQIYHLYAEMDASRIVRFYIDGTLVATSTALGSVTLKMFTAVHAVAAAAKAMSVHNLALSYKHAA